MIELSESIGFGYGLSDSDTQDGPRCWRKGIYILWLTSTTRDKDSGERSRTQEPSCMIIAELGPVAQSIKVSNGLDPDND